MVQSSFPNGKAWWNSARRLFCRSVLEETRWKRPPRSSPWRILSFAVFSFRPKSTPRQRQSHHVNHRRTWWSCRFLSILTNANNWLNLRKSQYLRQRRKKERREAERWMSRVLLPIKRKTRHEASVMKTKPVFHEWESLTVDKPMNMKIIVSIILDNIFKTYSVVALDFFEMLNDTYCFITIPQKVILKVKRFEKRGLQLESSIYAKMPETETISDVR